VSRVTKIFFERVAKTVAKPKSQNTYIKVSFESPKDKHQTTFETLKTFSKPWRCGKPFYYINNLRFFEKVS
jgi:hypothetical protein